jgi:hypothetical protein
MSRPTWVKDWPSSEVAKVMPAGDSAFAPGWNNRLGADLVDLRVLPEVEREFGDASFTGFEGQPRTV